jgi:two-component system NtrC family sensor kinase
MFSIQSRLKLLFVVIVTLVLAISGTYTQYSSRQRTGSSNQRLRQGVLTRLQISLPSALWDLDKSKVDSIVEAEMLPPEVVSIRVYDTSVGLFAGKLRAADGSWSRSRRRAGRLPGRSRPWCSRTAVRPAPRSSRSSVGKVVVNFSRAQIDAAWPSELMRKVAEVLLLDIILVLALSLSLRMVFEPLKQLRDGLFDLATRGTDEVEELPENRRDELGEVIRGFNQIQRRLKSPYPAHPRGRGRGPPSAQETAQGAARFAPDPGVAAAGRAPGLAGRPGGRRRARNQHAGRHRADQRLGAEGRHRRNPGGGPGTGLKKSDIMRYLDTAAESTRLIMNNAYRAAHLIHSFKQIAVDQTSEARRRFG